MVEARVAVMWWRRGWRRKWSGVVRASARRRGWRRRWRRRDRRGGEGGGGEGGRGDGEWSGDGGGGEGGGGDGGGGDGGHKQANALTVSAIGAQLAVSITIGRCAPSRAIDDCDMLLRHGSAICTFFLGPFLGPSYLLRIFFCRHLLNSHASAAQTLLL